MSEQARIECMPLTPERWRDFATLFGRNGACAGCWCMYWRLPGPEWHAGCGSSNRRRFRAVVGRGREPGVIAYVNGEPAAWCAVAPREDFTRLERSPTRRRFDALATWSITCFFTARPHRHRGLMEVLLRAALEHARSQGAQVVEGYPAEKKSGRLGSGSAGYMGVASTFRRAGFALDTTVVNGRTMRRYRCVL
jgi:GNAT superfamily N-acetyltransferase